MKKLLLSIMLMGATQVFGAVGPVSQVSVPLSAKYEEILDALQKMQKNDANFGYHDAVKHVSKEICSLLRPLRKLQRQNLCMLTYRMYTLNLNLFLLTSGMYTLQHTIFYWLKKSKIMNKPKKTDHYYLQVMSNNISCLFLGMAALWGCRDASAVLVNRVVNNPLDPRFNTVTSLSDFEWELVEHLDTLMTTPYAELSKEEKVMIDEMFKTLNGLYPQKYPHIDHLRLDFNRNQNLENVSMFLANQKNRRNDIDGLFVKMLK